MRVVIEIDEAPQGWAWTLRVQGDAPAATLDKVASGHAPTVHEAGTHATAEAIHHADEQEDT